MDFVQFMPLLFLVHLAAHVSNFIGKTTDGIS